MPNTTLPHHSPTFSDVLDAAERIKGVVHRTPVMRSRLIDEAVSQAGSSGVEISFKCENFQRVGAFKFRGGYYAVSSLSAEEAKSGVCTHSSGNHAQAIALAARERGVPAYIVMPNNAPKVKREAVKGYGAQIIDCVPTLEAREQTSKRVIAETGARFIHPYNHPRVIAGQGTAALELIEDTGPLDLIIAPIGGGGLMSGTSITMRAMCPQGHIWGAEPSGADDAARSLAAGRLMKQSAPDTICDGLLTSLGDLTWPIIQSHVSRIVTVDDDQVIAAMRLIWTRLKIIIEPSCATPLAALLKGGLPQNVSKIGVILSGGNVDLDRLPW